jgi:hypothetical protein
VEDVSVSNCEAYGNAFHGIHLGTGARRGRVRYNRTHNNGQDGLFLCWRVQEAVYEKNQSWGNDGDGISLGHKDTDNLFLENVISGNGRAGIFFRDETEANAAHRNVFRDNKIEDNGRPGVPGYGVRIEGTTQQLVFRSNFIRDTRKGAAATQQVGISIGPRADYVTCERNIFEGNLRQAIEDQSQGGHNLLQHPSSK